MLKSRLFLVTYLKILSSRRAITKTVALVLIIVAFVAALVPIDLYYSLLSQDLANKDSTPSPTPSSTISLTPTPSTQPTSTPTATPHPTQIPTYQPVLDSLSTGNSHTYLPTPWNRTKHH